MRPAESIDADLQELKQQIKSLVEKFEERTGAYVRLLTIPDFQQGRYRIHGQPIEVDIEIALSSQQAFVRRITTI